MRIKDLPIIERPREKLLRYGPERLNEAELLAVLIGSGQKGENALQLAFKMLKFGREVGIETLTVEKVRAQLDLSAGKASVLIACFELGKRLFKGKETQLLLSPRDVWSQLQEIRDQRKEHFVVFYLDIRNQIIKREIISIGTLNASLVHPREVFEPAVRESAAQIILSHNHPSHIVEPSEEDLHLTKRLISSGEILGIEIIDHIIVSNSAYYSFKEHRLL